MLLAPFRPLFPPQTTHSSRLSPLLSPSTGRTLAPLPFQPEDRFACLLQAATSTAAHGVVAATQHKRARFWDAWVAHCGSNNMDPNLRDTPTSTAVSAILTFAEFVRQGGAGQGHRVGHQT